jgi:PmbA protein
VAKALLIKNRTFELPGAETGSYEVESNFSDYEPAELAAKIAELVFRANTVENATINSLEIFLSRHTETLCNSRGLEKSQVRYSAMVEAIPTYNGEAQSVELYEQVNFSALDLKELSREIADKLAQAKARFEAKRVEITGSPKVILNSQELMELFWNFAYDLNFASIYSHHNVYNVGDALQTAPQGDLLGITMAASLPGCADSRCFDYDGLTLSEKRIIDGGKAVACYGANRFAQYMNAEPTGSLPILKLDPGTAEEETGPYLEVVSMSGIQTYFYSDYVGGEIRLAYWHDGETVRPVTGVSISGKVSEVLNHIRFSKDTALFGNYYGPRKAVIEGMNIF